MATNRKLARLRKEFIYRRSLKGSQAELYEKKRVVKKCLQEGKAVPNELRSEIHSLKATIDLEDFVSGLPKNDLDDEYGSAGVEDPRVMITTSYSPSQKLLQFVKEMSLVIPNCTRMNRGNHNIKSLIDASRQHGISDMIMVHESGGIPDTMIVSHLPLGPTAYFNIINVVTRHEIEDAGTMSLQLPHLIFHGFTTKMGDRVTHVLKYLFPPCKEDSTRVLTFANDNDFISFRHHTFKKKGNEVKLTEVGPRFELKLFQLKLGTIDMKDAENEWVLRPYMNTAYKNKTL